MSKVYTPDQIKIATEMTTPSGYAKHFLNLKLHPKQAEILDAIFDKPKTKVSALLANELGKTSVIGTVSILFALHMLNANVVSTSGTYRQIIKQLMPALKVHSSLYQGWEFLESSIKINGESRYVGFQTTDQGKWQGWHSKPNNPLYIFTDESAALDENVFQSIARCNPEYLLCAGSPLSPEGVFYRIETDPVMYAQYKHFKMNKFEALKKDGWWLDEVDINNFISQWGGKTHPLVLSSVFAEFSSQLENGLLSLNELDKCYEFPPTYIEGTKHIGIDVSASGGDKNVIAYRNGNRVEIIDEWIEAEVMRSCDRIVINLNKLRDMYGIIQSEVSLDADGMGIGFISRLKDLGWKVNEFHGGATPIDTNYSNRISECWLDGIKKIKNCAIILPNNNEFKMQLLSRKQLLTDKGKMKLEKKADMRARGVKSPDQADAVFLAISQPISTGITSIQPFKLQPKRYSMF